MAKETEINIDEYYSKLASGIGTTVENLKKETTRRMGQTLKSEIDCLYELGLEKGIDIKEPEMTKIKDIEKDKICNIVARLKFKTDVADKVSRKGDSYQSQLIRIADETGECFVSVYGVSNFEKLENANPNDIIAFKNARGTLWPAKGDFPESMNLNMYSSSSSFILINPDIEVDIPEIEKPTSQFEYIDLKGKNTSLDELEEKLLDDNGEIVSNRRIINWKLDGAVDKCGEKIEQTSSGNKRFWFVLHDALKEVYVTIWEKGITEEIIEDLLNSQGNDTSFTVSGVAKMYQPEEGNPRIQINCSKEGLIHKVE